MRTIDKNSVPITVTGEPGRLSLKVRSVPAEPLISRGVPGAERYTYGMEGGKVIRQGDFYYLFVTEMDGQPAWVKTSLGLWKSRDGRKWERVRTILESTGVKDGTDRRASLWTPVPTFDETLNRWVLTWTCYRARMIPGVTGNGDRNYDGEIAWAVSAVEGKEGLDAEYEERGVLMRPDHQSLPWEGHIGVCSFFPYEINGQWYAWYGSSIENNGGAYSETGQLLSGWRRFPTERPVLTQSENPVVFKINQELYICLYDGCSEHQAMGYMFSKDGLTWSKPKFISFAGFEDKWFELTRTPVGLFPREDGLWDLYFTAYDFNWYKIPHLWSSRYKEPDEVFQGYYASFGVIQIEITPE